MWRAVAYLVILVLFEAQGQLTSSSSSTSCSLSGDPRDICSVVEELNNLKSKVQQMAEQMDSMRKSNGNCQLQLQSYSFDCVSQLLGFIRVNNNEVFRCWFDRPAGYLTYYRGMNTAILNSMDCTASDLKWFDTCCPSITNERIQVTDRGSTQDFINYFTGLPTGSVLLGITCDDAYMNLSSALPMLKTAGVDVNGVGYRGMFAFILQKGYPGKTVFFKNPASDNCAALSLNVSIIGSTVDSLQFFQTIN